MTCIARIATLCLAVMLAACSGDNDGFGAADLTAGASPSLGLVRNALVTFHRNDGTTLLGSADTGSTGAVSVSLDGYNGPVVVTVVGDGDAEYFDESAGAFLPFPAGNEMHALVARAGATVGVTPLTELAYRRAVALGFLPGITAAQVNAVNEAVRAALAPGLESILSVPTAFDAATGAGALADTEAGRYALYLAALAELGAGETAPALAVMQALADDGADGALDGMDGSDPVPLTGDFLADMAAALATAAAAYGTRDLQDAADEMEPASTELDAGGGTGGDTVPADTLHAGLVGTHNLVYSQEAAGGPFADEEAVIAVVGANRTLQIDGKTLTDPYFNVIGGAPHTAEIIWLDAASGIEYALTDNTTGTFNEINVGNSAGTLLGQLRVDEGPGDGIPDALQERGGSYTHKVVQKSSGAPMGTYALNQDVPFTVNGDTGVIVVDGAYTFDPAAPGFLFQDNTNSTVEPHLYVMVPDASLANATYEFRIFIRDDAVVAARLTRQVPNCCGGTEARNLELEQRPLPQAHTDFFATLIAASPVTVTVYHHAPDNFSGYPAVCQTMTLAFRDPADTASSTWPFGYEVTAGGFDSQNYRRADTFYAAAAGAQSLQFSRNRVTRRVNGSIAFESVFANNVQARASNDPADLAACN